jgi:hypothetical protein
VQRTHPYFYGIFKGDMCTLRCSRGLTSRATWAAFQSECSINQRVYLMRSFQEKLLIFTGNSTNLRLQISELNELRERLRKAEQFAQKVRQTEAAEKSANIERSAHP